MTYYTEGIYTLCCRVAGFHVALVRGSLCARVSCRTHVAQARVNDAMHLCDSPLDYVAKALVIDKKVLPAHRTLCSFFEFILTMARANGSVSLGSRAALAVSGFIK
jgi:hypothetical protein